MYYKNQLKDSMCIIIQYVLPTLLSLPDQSRSSIVYACRILNEITLLRSKTLFLPLIVISASPFSKMAMSNGVTLETISEFVHILPSITSVEGLVVSQVLVILYIMCMSQTS